jgi:transcriptional regulator with PAS, ATPase and Fis domain
LCQAVKEGRFRADLYYRLNVYPVRIPALRERQEDIPLLIEHFLEKMHSSYQKKTLGLSDRASETCQRYAWPGNIRELENLIERGVIITESNQSISVEALFPSLSDEAKSVGLSTDIRLDKPVTRPADEWVEQLLDCGLSLEALEEQLFHGAMERAGQNISEAARLLGMTRPALAYRLKKLHGEPASS